jgi:uncharacterized membrane protein YfcA
VDGARTPFYLWSQGEALLGYVPRIATAAVGVAVGTIAGGRVLSSVPEPWFRPIIAIVILLLGVWVLSQLA